MEKRQREAAEFLRKHGLEAKEETRLLDLHSELGELSKELLKASDYGTRELMAGKAMEEELGDCVFSLLCLSEALGINADRAFERVLEKYKSRMEQTGQIGSGK